MPFTKGNKLGIKGRPKGILSEAQRLKVYLIKLLLTNKEELKRIPKKELLRCIAPLLPKEQTIHQDTEPITINIDTKRDEKTTIQANSPTTSRLTGQLEPISLNTPNNKVNEINDDMPIAHRVDKDNDIRPDKDKEEDRGIDTPDIESQSEEA